MDPFRVGDRRATAGPDPDAPLRMRIAVAAFVAEGVTLGPMEERDCKPVRLGVRDGLGVPGLALGATYVGLGVTANSQGLPLAETVASTLLAFSVSGQAAFIHATASSAPLLPLGIAVLAANVRLLPLAAGIVAHIRRPDGPPGWFTLLVALLTAATAWANVSRRAERMPKRALASYALVVAAVLWLASTAGIGIGWLLLGVIPPALAAGLAFLAAAYFGVLMAADAAKGAARALAVLSGAVLAPALAADLGDWASVAAGLVGAAVATAQAERTAAHAAAAAAARAA